MRFTKDIEYALISLTAMSGENRLYSARELSAVHTIPYGLLCKILQRLAHGNIVESVQGPRGGYRIARSPEEITLGEIIAVVQGHTSLAPCLDGEEDCVQRKGCAIRGTMLKVQSLWEKMLGSLSLSEFASSHGSDFAGIPTN